jgi:hypothetical protein
MTLRRTPLALLLLVGGCATGGDFPSLAPRPVERLSFEEPVRTDPVVPADPAFRSQAAQLLGAARQGNAAFEAEYARALPRVRGAGAAGSDPWVQAQEAISRVAMARKATTDAAAALERLAENRADDPTSPADHQALMAAVAAAHAIVEQQQRRFDGLRGSLRAP